MEIKYLDPGIEQFISRLDETTTAKLIHTIDLLERFGHALRMPHSKKIDEHLFELRLTGRQNVRVFYTFHQKTIVLLHGCIKKSQRIPEKELDTARRKRMGLA
ncbi:type II toxin-antitoxin system RelE/ParE family toxin [Patescibacteria group bacterium]|nr:type II toxin-antitoxin system RelE/ParE family toxin [Patescibacteria group bacterium]MBU1034304.1 type II toxin-antitoxin system RelE/ParE family toxin [Patescibacteria group bacterium]MBU1629512.1 type II toxin-antitoxin system RelE/ParE family toxin [Patescibacteria group bacterium]MBU1907539.1 type II toxin-antitoxin system RelE/ParE family toxin [Patescibacteria group bacterium]